LKLLEGNRHAMHQIRRGIMKWDSLSYRDIQRVYKQIFKTNFASWQPLIIKQIEFCLSSASTNTVQMVNSPEEQCAVSDGGS